LDPLISSWTESSISPTEQARRLVDLFVISVFLDAGAGNEWKFKTEEGDLIGKSEGLALASLEMWKKGTFSVTGTGGKVDGEKDDHSSLERI
jgi:hypothetical protein